MLNRRLFVKNAGLVCAGLALPPAVYSQIMEPGPFVSNRPLPEKRHFSSPAVEAKIAEVTSALKDKELAWLFANCFPNTLDTTVTVGELDGKPDTYVGTGDIPAMWLRDSSAQVWPYLSLIKQDPSLEKLIQGVVNRHAACVMIDPYANAFYQDRSRESSHKDKTEMRPGVQERKWEVDSLCYVIRLAHGYWKAGGDPVCFDPAWLAAMKLIVRTFKEQQRKDNPGPYNFQRLTDWPRDTASGGSRGNLTNPNGLICSVFRPSDDGTIFPYLIPSNYFAVVSLRQLAELVTAHFREKEFVLECTALADEVHRALTEYATVEHKVFGRILAYEVDGFGGCYLADDANVPNLLSLPYLGGIAPEDQPLYQNTRRFLLSTDGNPYYVKGTAAEGISGSHCGRDNIWPMGIIMRAMTSADEGEITQSLRFLKVTHANTGFMHESFYKNDPNKFTRKWFAWANTLFGEFIVKLLSERPHLLT